MLFIIFILSFSYVVITVLNFHINNNSLYSGQNSLRKKCDVFALYTAAEITNIIFRTDGKYQYQSGSVHPNRRSNNQAHPARP